MDIKNNYYFKSFEGINLVYSEYWDFNLIPDNIGDCFDYATNCRNSSNYNIITDGLVTWFDVNQTGTTLDGSYLKSLISWTGTEITPSSGFTLNDWGLTGVDNGRTDCLSGKTLIITSADTKLILYPVTGYTISYNGESGCTVSNGLYTYPWYLHLSGLTKEGCPVGNTICLDGGFYQGFFKLDTDKPAPKQEPYVECNVTGYTLTSISATTKWGVMPTTFPTGWSMETWIKWDNSFCSSGDTSGLTLNQIYTGNTNFFFYIGTRAENKFQNNFSGETGLKTTTGIPLSNTETLEFDQKVKNPNDGQDWFTINGTSTSLSCCCPTCGFKEEIDSNIITGGQNWFSTNGLGVGCCIICSGNTETTVVTGKTYSYCDQLSENALGFRITDDGRIGYRKMTVTGDCYNNKYRITGTVMEEGYSEPNIIPTTTGKSWNHIAVTYTAGSGIKNTLPSGTLKFWINGLVKYKVDNFIGLQLRALDEWSDKQIGVPFNMSWGGGTQGLLESQTFGGPDYNDRNLLLEKNFAGTFEGELSQLRFYEKPLNVLEVRNNFFIDCGRYCRPDTFGGAQIVQPDSSYCNNCGETYQKIDTPEEVLSLNILANYLPGSIICNYSASTNFILDKDLPLSLTNKLFVKSGLVIQVNPQIIIKSGTSIGTASITLNEDFSRLSGDFEITSFIYDKTNFNNIKISENVTIIPINPPPPPPPPPPPVVNSIYYGKLASQSYILSAETTFNKIDVNDGRNMYVNLPYGVGYGYILISNSINQPVLFRNSNEGCAGFVVPMVNQGTTTIVDVNGNSVVYNIYRTFVATKASVDIWLCD